MIKGGFFQKGFDSVENMKQEQQASANSGIYDFYVKDGEDALVRFLTDEPIAFKAHTIKVGKAPRVFLCTEDDNCLGCRQPDSFNVNKPNKASVKAAFLVLDGREFEADEKVNGQPTGKKVKYTDQVRVMVRGVTDVANIQMQKQKYGLLNRTFTCSKRGMKNPYTFDRNDNCPEGKDPKFWSQEVLSPEAMNEIIEKLPEKYRDLAKGEDGLYGVLYELFKPYGINSSAETTEVLQEPTALTRC